MSSITSDEGTVSCPVPESARALQTALDRIVCDTYYSARVLARAEAFLRHAPTRGPKAKAKTGKTAKKRSGSRSA